MYAAYFGLNDEPYAIAPDPRYLYLSRRHRKALADLRDGLQAGSGCAQLTGAIGIGKTTFCRALTQALPGDVDVLLIPAAPHSAGELLLAICSELGVRLPRGRVAGRQVIECLHARLRETDARGRRTLLVVDEAQNLSVKALEQIQLLLDLKAEGRRLLPVFLVGQAELRTLLAHKSLRLLAQRISARFHLEPLTPAETDEYIRHRLQAAGGDKMLFKPAAVREIFQRSGGVPRTINILCDRALLGAYVTGKERVDRRIVRNSALDIAGKTRGRTDHWWTPYAWAGAAGIAMGAVGLSGYYISGAHPSPPASMAKAAPAAPKAPTPAMLAARKAARADAADAPPVSTPAASPDASTHLVADGSGTAPPQPPSLESLLRQATDRTGAERELVDLWGLSYPQDSSQPLCQWAASHGLQCLNREGSWATLRRLNRPAMLWLTDASGRRSYAVLSSVSGPQVRLELGGSEQSVSMHDLDPYWHGQFLLLWKPPVPSVDIIRKGAPADAVHWLRTALNKIQRPPTLNEHASAYDWNVVKQVMAFQRRVGLPVDGTVGAQTFIMLTTALGDPRTPLLSPPPSIAQVAKDD